MRSVIVLAVAILLTASLLAAQDSTPTSEPVNCTIDGLKAYYAGLVAEGQAALDAAVSDTSDGSDLDPEMLGMLYDAGKSLQAQMLGCGYIPEDIQSMPVGVDTTLERVLEVLDTLRGDPLRGQLLYLGEDRSAINATLGCAGCHEAEDDVPSVGPPTEGTWTRWDEQYRLEPQFADHDFAYFAAESILHPNAYVPEGYLENLMPAIYDISLSYQDLADLIAFLESQDQLPED